MIDKVLDFRLRQWARFQRYSLPGQPRTVMPSNFLKVARGRGKPLTAQGVPTRAAVQVTEPEWPEGVAEIDRLIAALTQVPRHGYKYARAVKVYAMHDLRAEEMARLCKTSRSNYYRWLERGCEFLAKRLS